LSSQAKVYNGLCPSRPVIEPRYAAVRTLSAPLNGSNILDDNAIVLYFPGPKTVTGEEVLELHIHGGPATVKAVLSAIPQCPSTHPIRYAEPGEFTRRAFQNNRLDLAQVEALSDMLSAETEQQRRAALRGNSGKLGRTYEGWREQLLLARGEMEAMIDFSEDQHFDETALELLERASAQVRDMIESIAAHEKAGQVGEMLKKGIRISLLGPPNAGKSSLMNRIVGREASIVSQEAGTTRDIVEVSLDVRGYLCTFADTAGLRTRPEGMGEWGMIGNIEQEGIRRAKAKASESDVIIAMASVEPTGEEQWMIRYDQEALTIAEEAEQALVVVNKTDSVPLTILHELLSDFQGVLKAGTPVITVSCKDALSGSNQNLGNIHHFVDQLADIFKNMTALPPDMEDLVGVTARQRQLLSNCVSHLMDFLDEAISESGEEGDIVLAAEHLRSAANCLSRITGRGAAGDVEEVLGVVFEKCEPLLPHMGHS
jgi:tRNA modification GTPase